MIHNGHVVYASWQENGKRRGPGISEVKKQKPWKKGRARVRSRRELPRFENSRNVETTEMPILVTDNVLLERVPGRKEP